MRATGHTEPPSLPAGDRQVSRLFDVYGWLIEQLGLLAGLLFALMTLGIAVDVALRNLAGSGVGWLIELVEYAMPVATLLAAPWVLREGSHATVDLLVSRVPTRAARPLRILVSLIGLVVCLAVAWFGWKATALAIERASLVFKTLVFPEWWVLALIPVGMSLMAMEFARQLFGSPPVVEPPAAPGGTSSARTGRP